MPSYVLTALCTVYSPVAAVCHQNTIISGQALARTVPLSHNNVSVWLVANYKLLNTN